MPDSNPSERELYADLFRRHAGQYRLRLVKLPETTSQIRVPASLNDSFSTLPHLVHDFLEAFDRGVLAGLVGIDVSFVAKQRPSRPANLREVPQFLPGLSQRRRASSRHAPDYVEQVKAAILTSLSEYPKLEKFWRFIVEGLKTAHPDRFRHGKGKRSEFDDDIAACELLAEAAIGFDPHAPYMPAEWFRDKYGIPADRLRSARRDGRMKAVRPDRSGRWHYSVPDARNLWPDDLIEIPRAHV